MLRKTGVCSRCNAWSNVPAYKKEILLYWCFLGSYDKMNIFYENLCRTEDNKFLQEACKILAKKLNWTDLPCLLMKIFTQGQHKFP